jgi:copper chaperone CopZ
MSDHKTCHVEAVEKPVEREALYASTVAYLEVIGMGCPTCAMRVRNGLLSQTGVLLVDVNLERKYAAVAYDPQQINPNALMDAVENAGNDGKHQYWAEVIFQVPAREALHE